MKKCNKHNIREIFGISRGFFSQKVFNQNNIMAQLEQFDDFFVNKSHRFIENYSQFSEIFGNYNYLLIPEIVRRTAKDIF